MDKYVLRYLVLGQLILLGLMAWSGIPADDAIYFTAIAQSLGMFAALDFLGLSVAYFLRRYEFTSFVHFIKTVW